MGGDVLLYDGTTLQLLEGAAAHVWERLDGTRTVDELVASAVKTFGATAEQVDRDVLEFLVQLDIRGMVEMVDGDILHVPTSTGWVPDGDVVLLVDLVNGRRRTLGLSGTAVWMAVLDGGGAADVVERVRSLYPDARPDDVEALLEELVDERLLLRGR